MLNLDTSPQFGVTGIGVLPLISHSIIGIEEWMEQEIAQGFF